MRYYTLFTREDNGRWYPQWGSHIRSEVMQERRDSYRDRKVKDTKIVGHEDTPEGLAELLLQLNHPDPPYRF